MTFEVDLNGTILSHATSLRLGYFLGHDFRKVFEHVLKSYDFLVS